MPKYARTKKGEILDLENIKFKTIDNTLYYKDFVFEEIRQDGNDIRLDYTAIGTENNDLEEQRGKICKFALLKYDDEILNQADTIEELCDEFVLDERLYYKIEDLKMHIKQLKELNRWPAYMINPYGAIWTEWGLKYVAKMNEEGKLELI